MLTNYHKCSPEELKIYQAELEKKFKKVKEEFYAAPIEQYSLALTKFMTDPIRLELNLIDALLRKTYEPALYPIEMYDDHMSLQDFKESCETGCFMDDDGYGVYATKDQKTDIQIYPSDFRLGVIRSDFEYVVWYNK